MPWGAREIYDAEDQYGVVFRVYVGPHGWVVEAWFKATLACGAYDFPSLPQAYDVVLEELPLWSRRRCLVRQRRHRP